MLCTWPALRQRGGFATIKHDALAIIKLAKGQVAFTLRPMFTPSTLAKLATAYSSRKHSASQPEVRSYIFYILALQTIPDC